MAWAGGGGDRVDRGGRVVGVGGGQLHQAGDVHLGLLVVSAGQGGRGRRRRRSRPRRARPARCGRGRRRRRAPRRPRAPARLPGSGRGSAAWSFRGPPAATTRPLWSRRNSLAVSPALARLKSKRVPRSPAVAEGVALTLSPRLSTSSDETQRPVWRASVSSWASTRRSCQPSARVVVSRVKACRPLHALDQHAVHQELERVEARAGGAGAGRGGQGDGAADRARRRVGHVHRRRLGPGCGERVAVEQVLEGQEAHAPQPRLAQGHALPVQHVQPRVGELAGVVAGLLPRRPRCRWFPCGSTRTSWSGRWCRTCPRSWSGGRRRTPAAW